MPPVVVDEEDLLAVVAPPSNVMQNAGKNDTCDTWHKGRVSAKGWGRHSRQATGPRCPNLPPSQQLTTNRDPNVPRSVVLDLLREHPHDQSARNLWRHFWPEDGPPVSCEAPPEASI